MFLRCSPELHWKGFALLLRLIFPAMETNNNNPTEDCQGLCLLGRMLHSQRAFLQSNYSSALAFRQVLGHASTPGASAILHMSLTYHHPQLCNINFLKNHPAYLTCKQLPA